MMIRIAKSEADKLHRFYINHVGPIDITLKKFDGKFFIDELDFRLL